MWCVCWKDIHSKESGVLTDYEAIRQFFLAKRGYKFIGHNILGYDAPVLNRLVGTKIPNTACIDTFLLSMVYNPSLAGGHSLDSWGARLKFPKGHFNDWSKLSDEMITYCINDVELCWHVFDKLGARMSSTGFTEKGIEIEHRAWAIIRKQRKNGFHFNQQDAHLLYAKLREIENGLRYEIRAFWPPVLQVVREFKQSRKKDGTHTLGYEKHLAEYPRLEINADGSYRAFDFVEFNLGSPVQRIEKLIELGWKPVEKTKKGSPKVTDKGELVPSLEAFLQETPHEGARLLVQWLTINSRANMINTWLEAYNERTGCIHGTLFLANTLRYRHSSPNTANIPRVRQGNQGILLAEQGAYTYESRSLWSVRDPVNRSLVGVDAKSIQLRVLAHYLNNEDFTKAVLTGDPHDYNRQLGGFRDRDTAKTFIYAFLLGAGDGKVGEIVGGTTKDGGQIKRRFVNNFPGLRELIQSLERQVERTGRIILCDGTPILVSSKHMVLGYLLQGDESRIMKQAMIYVDGEIRRAKLDVLKVGDIHDEWQSDVLTAHVPRYSEACERSFAKSGREFNYRLPIECSINVGKTWAETH